MAKDKTITIRKAKDIFPEKYTLIRAHDLISKSASKKLTKKESDKLIDVASEVRSGNLFEGNTDLMVTRNGKRLKIEPF